jgi:hypothetical protein
MRAAWPARAGDCSSVDGVRRIRIFAGEAGTGSASGILHEFVTLLGPSLVKMLSVVEYVYVVSVGPRAMPPYNSVK